MRRLVRYLLNIAPMFLIGAVALHAQGVTTGSMSGTVTANGAPVPGVSVVALHVESGSRYGGVTREDGRYQISSMRVGGPYRISVSRIGFQRERLDSVFITLGQVTQANFQLKSVATQLEAVSVSGIRDPTMSPDRTGAATTVPREAIASMPTISNRLESLVRLTPQSGGTGSTAAYTFVGQDPRYNNITIDGSYFNNSFGLGNTPGDRTGVAPISLSAVEQVQVNVAPFDVREGHFVGASVNTVTRSGTNQFRGSVFYQGRNQNYVGRRAGLTVVDPGTSQYHNGGGWISGPIIKDKLFFFANYESENLAQPATAFRANKGGETNAGNVSRVLASDLDALSTFLTTKFNFNPGSYEGYNKNVPATRYLGKLDYNLNESNKLSFRYTQLSSSTDVLLSSSSSVGFGTRQPSLNSISFTGSNYSILENIKSYVAELNSSLGNNWSNHLIAGYTANDESRGPIDKLFPFVDILNGTSVYTSFGSEPFTPSNVLQYHTYQAQDNLTIYKDRHTLTFGIAGEKYHSLNIFYPGSQSAYVYNSLADFYADANGYLANPNRCAPANPVNGCAGASPVTARTFQVRYMNLPGLTQPIQPLDVWYGGLYAQDSWAATKNLNLMFGLRVDASKFANTAYDNPNADKLTFADQNGTPTQYNSGALPKTTPYWSPRFGFNWDASGDRQTQIRGGTGVFTGSPAYVWISNQIGNTGLLTGFTSVSNTKDFPFNPNPETYKPTSVNGTPAVSYELNVTDPNFKFPQTWRSDIAIDKHLPFGLIGTAEFIYNYDINDVYYINANLPAATSPQASCPTTGTLTSCVTRYTGADTRVRYTGAACPTAGSATGASCITRLNQQTGNLVTSAFVLTNKSGAFSWNTAFSLERSFGSGLYLKGAYSYTLAKSYFDPSSTASSNWSVNQTPGDPNNPGLGYSFYWPGSRFFLAGTLKKDWFAFGSTTISSYSEWKNQGNFSYIFSGDANGDGQSSNDLLYIPRDTSEMYFRAITGAAPFTADQQKLGWEKYIQQDKYLSSHRGAYAERNAVLSPVLFQTDLSFSQELGRSIGGRMNGLEARIDILNFGNLLNHNWGLGTRFVSNSPLVSPAVDAATGRLTYQMRTLNNALVDHTFDPSGGVSDVYRLQLSLRYNFY